MLAFETCFLQLSVITVENKGEIALDSQNRMCIYAKQTSDSGIYRQFETSVLSLIKMFRYLTSVTEHLKPRLEMRARRLQEHLIG